MSRLARKFSNSGIYHIVFRGVNQQSIFEEDADYKKLKDCIELIKSQMGTYIFWLAFSCNSIKRMLYLSRVMKNEQISAKV